MQIYQGKSVFSGIAIGKIRVYKKNERQVKRVKVENPDAEMARFEEAKAKGIAQFCMKKHAKRLARPMQRSSRYIR